MQTESLAFTVGSSGISGAFAFPAGIPSVAWTLDLSPFSQRPQCQIAGLLVHESVHIWQEWCAYYGESDPGREQEAYAIQSIAQELMAEFARRMEN